MVVAIFPSKLGKWIDQDYGPSLISSGKEEAARVLVLLAEVLEHIASKIIKEAGALASVEATQRCPTIDVRHIEEVIKNNILGRYPRYTIEGDRRFGLEKLVAKEYPCASMTYNALNLLDHTMYNIFVRIEERFHEPFTLTMVERSIEDIIPSEFFGDIVDILWGL